MNRADEKNVGNSGIVETREFFIDNNNLIKTKEITKEELLQRVKLPRGNDHSLRGRLVLVHNGKIEESHLPKIKQMANVYVAKSNAAIVYWFVEGRESEELNMVVSQNDSLTIFRKDCGKMTPEYIYNKKALTRATN